jgi:hypothetical protein
MAKGIILGTNRFHMLNQYEVDCLLDTALGLGIRQIDTAPTYETSEKKIGNFLKRNPGTFEISTKIFRNLNIDLTAARDSLEISFERLGISQIKCLYVHGAILSSDDSSVIELLQSCRSGGSIQEIGWCGNVTPKLKNLPNLYDTLMVRVNPWDRAIESRADLLGVDTINAMNIFANGFWNYKHWGKLKTFYSARVLRRFNPSPSFYLSHPERLLMEPYQDFRVLTSFSLSRHYLDNLVLGTIKQSHLKQIIGWIEEIDRLAN